jgi:hypothetical protein
VSKRKRGNPGSGQGPFRRAWIPPWLFYLVAGSLALAAAALVVWSFLHPPGH